jgi:hypothetical protein
VEDPIGFLDFLALATAIPFTLGAADSRIRVGVPFSWPNSLMSAHRPPGLAYYGAQDRRLIGDLSDVTKAMSDADVDFTSGLPGLGHACFNDRSQQTYDEASAPTPGSER